MTASNAQPVNLLPPAAAPRQEVGFWAMVLFCLTEAAFFTYLLSSYFYLGVNSVAWPPAGIQRPTLGKPLMMTVLLVSSSVVLFSAERARERGRRSWYRLGTALTIALGLGFLALQVAEYREKLVQMPPRIHAYASLFYTITGFHGAHVSFGILVLGWTLLSDVRGRLSRDTPVAVKNASLYWHFVDSVWLVLLVCLYLSPRWY